MPLLLRLSASFLWLLLPVGAASAQAGQGPLSDDGFRRCVNRLSQQTGLAQKPLARADFDRIASTAKYQDRVRTSALAQADEPAPVWDELAATTDAERVADGLAVLERSAKVFDAIEQAWKVPRAVLVGLYGIETDYGPRAGNIPVLDAALTLACLRPCASAKKTCPSRERAYAAVRVIRDGHVKPDRFVGSWAAAFGRTQFVPDTFEQLAVDFDKDGYRDIVDSEADAWASTANFLSRRGGWKPGLALFIEVEVPAKVQATFRGNGSAVRRQAQRKPWSAWQKEGWKLVDTQGDGVAVAPGTLLYPFLPAGFPGPAMLVTSNFDALLSYNPYSLNYPVKVGVLARKLRGWQGFVTPWPTDDPGLSRADVRRLQQWLADRGHAKVTPDGIVGAHTREAIEAELRRKGMPPARRVGTRTMAELLSP